MMAAFAPPWGTTSGLPSKPGLSAARHSNLAAETAPMSAADPQYMAVFSFTKSWMVWRNSVGPVRTWA